MTTKEKILKTGGAGWVNRIAAANLAAREQQRPLAFQCDLTIVPPHPVIRAGLPFRMWMLGTKRKAALLALFLLLGYGVCSPVQAQALGGNEVVAGAALNVALRAPFVARSWRRPIQRFALATAVSIAHERFVDGNWGRPGHHALADVRGRLVGYVITETVVALVRKVAR